ncbi:MAG: ComEC/Rec2 family competence protein [Rhodospirillales bacterium]
MFDLPPTEARSRSLFGRLVERGLAERERWFLWTPVLVGIGIAFYFALAAEPPPWTGGVATALAAGAALIAARHRSHPRASGLMIAALAALCVAGGFAAAQLRTHLVAAPVLGHRIGPVTVTGRLVGVETFPVGTRLTLDGVRIRALPPAEVPRRVRLRLRGGQGTWQPGDEVKVTAVLSPLMAPAAPGAFDFQRHAFFLGLGATGYVIGQPELLATTESGGGSGIVDAIGRLRAAMAARVRAAVAGPPGEMIVALIVGEQTGLPAPVMQALRDAGLAHLLSISGLHIGMVGGFLFFWMRTILALIPWLCLRVATKKVAALVAIAGSAFYMLLADASVPTQRAFFMLAIVMVAVLFDRRAISMRLVAWAALIILLTQPESLLGASFQMSFAAMVGLIAGYEELVRRRHGRQDAPVPLRRAAVYTGSILVSTLIATAATSPFAIYHFNRLALFGALTNVVAIPLTGVLVMPAGVVAVALMPFGLEGLALQPMAWGTEAIIRLAEWAAAMPAAAVLVPVLPVWGLGLMTMGGLWLCLWRTPWRLAGLVAVTAGLLAMAAASPPDVLADGNGKLFGVRLGDGRLALSGAAGGFARKTWSQRLADSQPPVVWPKEGSLDGDRLRCDPLGCVFRTNGRTVAFPRRAIAPLDDCRIADVVIASASLPEPCASAIRTIDGRRLGRDGTHALWLGDAQVQIEAVSSGRGRRPWVLSPAADEEDE